MGDQPDHTKNDQLAQALQTIAEQTLEIQRLRHRLEEEWFARELRDALILAATAGTIAAPVTHSRLLEMIVDTAADVISARAAALFLIDDATQELVFEVALGQKAEQVKHFRIPLGHGIAGLVAASGQPMAISDAQRDPRHAHNIAATIGYMPQSILCVPLFYNDRTIGVLELLDKVGAPSFDAQDMDALGLFANQAAVAIEQSRTQQSLSALIAQVLETMGDTPQETRQGLYQRGTSFTMHIEEDLTYQQSLDLARLVQEIVAHGENEFKACQTILRGFADYLRTREKISELGVLP